MNNSIIQHLSTFLATFHKIFEEPRRLASTASSLMRIRQGNLMVGQYAIKFRTLSSKLGWNNEALVATFWEGLSGRIKEELAGRDIPSSLEDLISLATRIDLRLLEHTREVTQERRTSRLAATFRSTPPHGRIYPVSQAEIQAMSEYVKENLVRGFIQKIKKSSSPARVGFFFVKKKDRSLQHCVDYLLLFLNCLTVFEVPRSTQSSISRERPIWSGSCQISYFTPPAELSNKFFYPSSLSVAPTLSSQAKGIARLLQQFGWSWVGVLSQETSSSSLGQTFLKELETVRVCLAFWEYIPSEYSPKDVTRISDVIRQSTANVVVVFSHEAYLNPVLLEFAFDGDTRDIIWLTSDAWSTSPRLVSYQLSKFLRGTLGLVLRNGAAPGFKEFVFGLHPSHYHNHSFFMEFWEEAFSCQWMIKMNNGSLSQTRADSTVPVSSSTLPLTPSPSPSSSKVLCTGLEDPATLQIFSDIGDLRVTYNVYKAVIMVAKTLKDMAACRQIERSMAGSHCVEMNNFTPWQLFFYLRRVRLKGNIKDDLYFDSLGNAPAIYDIINWQEGLSGGANWVSVGSYESGAQFGQDLFINLSTIQWGGQFNQIPISVCSKNCPPGFWKAPHLGQPHCCFDCIPCAVGEISNQTNTIDCFPCPEEEWPNSYRDQCLPREVELLSLSEPLGVSLGGTSILGSFLPALVLFLFIKNRETPLVRANNCTLSFILLGALTFSFLCPLLLLAPPGKQICLIRQAAFGVVFTLCISCLLAKTIIVVLAFRANHPGGCLRVPMGPWWPIVFAMFCTSIQFILCCSWFSVDPPFPEHDARTLLGKIVIRCNYGLGFWFMLGYLGLLSAICFMVAFLARKLPGAFNEATHITFSMLVFLTVWISFVPTYLSTQGKLEVATEIFAILSSSAGLLFCIFTPKVYIILVRPQFNTRAMVSGQQRMQTTINQSGQPPYGRRYPGAH
ncbi:extracellular calcium-sensing receptor-like [Anomaloglossus baeobatrachus]|uniref:extracellular calcium-sensing receptor-like n=1 Tax=Anomaloglossus baeobatrachus TaxID=238106 RepID=UPI003F4F883B